MAELKQIRKRMTIAAGVLAGVSVLCGLYALVPVVGPTNPELYRELEQTRTEYKIKEAQVRPLRGLPEKLVASHKDISMFYRTRLPAEQADVSEELGKLASKSNVTLSEVRYDSYDTDIPSLSAIIMDAQLSGDYGKVARFINSVERDKTFFIIDGLTLGDQKAGSVRLDIKLETYLRPAGMEDTRAEKDKKKLSGQGSGD